MKPEDCEQIIKKLEDSYGEAIMELATKVRKELVIPLCKKARMKFYSGMGVYFFDRKGIGLEHPEGELRKITPRFNYKGSVWADYCNVHKTLEQPLFNGLCLGNYVDEYRVT